jgi:hypothetical protein
LPNTEACTLTQHGSPSWMCNTKGLVQAFAQQCTGKLIRGRFEKLTAGNENVASQRPAQMRPSRSRSRELKEIAA